MALSTADNVEGAAYLGVFLVIMFIASRIMVRFNTVRFNRAFEPLVGTIGGHLRSGGAQSMMEGTYGGRSVLVAVSHGVSTHDLPGDPRTKRNLLEINVTPVTGADDWKIIYRSFNAEDWRATSSNDALKGQLAAAGAVALVNSMGIYAYVTYSAQFKKLTYVEDIRPQMAPSVHRLETILELLANLDAINTRLNPA